MTEGKKKKKKDDRGESEEPEAGPKAYCSGKPSIPSPIHLFLHSFAHSFIYSTNASGTEPCAGGTMENPTILLVLKVLTYQ